MMRKRTIINRLLIAAPWLTIIMLAALSYLLPNRTQASPQAQEQRQRVAAAMAEAPYFIGRWVGEDEAVPPEAQKLLRPNAILSRSFTKIGSPPTHVLLVHCSDARDMLGHYPPICYPTSGWRPMSAEPRELTLTANGHQVPATQYVFRRYGERGREDMIRVFNAFILPDGRITPRIEDIHRQGERFAVAAQGVAQLQMITPAAASFEQAVEAANELLSGMSNLFDALHVGGDQ